METWEKSRFEWTGPHIWGKPLDCGVCSFNRLEWVYACLLSVYILSFCSISNYLQRFSDYNLLKMIVLNTIAYSKKYLTLSKLCFLSVNILTFKYHNMLTLHVCRHCLRVSQSKSTRESFSHKFHLMNPSLWIRTTYIMLRVPAT